MSNNNTRRPPVAKGGGMHGGGIAEKPKDFKKSIRFLLSHLAMYKILIIFVVILSVGSTIFSIVSPKILGNATTEIFEGLLSRISGGDGVDIKKISRIMFILLVLYSISAVFSYIQGLVTTGISQKITFKMREQLSEKIHRLPMSYFDKRSTGDVLSIITNDIETISNNINQSSTQIITSIISIIGILIMMASINIVLTLVSILILPLSLGIITGIVKKSQKHFTNQQEYLGRVNGHIEESFGGHNIITAFNNQEQVISTFEESNQVLYKSAWKSQFLSGLMMPIMTFISNIGYVAVAVLGGIFVIQGKMKVGQIQSFITYNKNFTMPIGQVAQISNLLQSTAAAAERVQEFLSQDEEIEIENPTKLPIVHGDVEFKNVKFGYNEDKIIIGDFSTSVKSGQKIAIVGPTGAGKTTLVKLLMRFYDINAGQILVDGVDIKKMNRGDLRQMFGMVLQDTWLFNGSIKENIRYGRLDATDDEVIDAAKSAFVYNFIKTLPDSFDMQINEEASNISQGQKQLLTIARAILADPKILILDEATSSVDTRTEIRIQQAMDNLMHGRTSFIIAHRLSTIRNADHILVMNDGDVIEQGTHDELLQKGEFYANLYNSQFENTDDIA